MGDDAGARPASARLQVQDARGHYQWYGTWHRLRLRDRYGESYAFTVTESHRGTDKFRAVVSGGYAAANPVTVVVR